jgi:hypothetical protein
MQASVDWFLGFVKHIKPGGMWAIPRNGAVYRIEHDTKTLHAVVGSDAPTVRVAKAAGWSIE